MLRLYILRHAKSSWALPGRSDYDRGLNDRGKKDLVKIGRSMAANSYLPDHVYCSSAKRTRLTFEGICKSITAFDPSTDFVDDLYSGSLDNYLNTLMAHTNDKQSLMIIGHNPTCDALASYLISEGKKDAIQTLAYKYPTGGLAVIDLKYGSWKNIGENNGYLVDFLLPKQMQS